MIRIPVNNMDGQHSRKAVTEVLQAQRFNNFRVDDGFIELYDNENPHRISHLGACLLKAGYELVYDHQRILVQRISHLVTEMVNNWENRPNLKISVYLSDKLNLNYNYLSNIFSEYNKVSLRQFIINKRIEKVKKLLLHSGLNLTEIALMLNYSSVAHLSNQFRKTTGLSASEFKALHLHNLIHSSRGLEPFAEAPNGEAHVAVPAEQ
jgi:AraC-like DNA-binding protein